MRVLLIGGTGLISTGIVKYLRDRHADITMFNRGQRGGDISKDIRQLHGDRNEFASFEQTFGKEKFDVVIDMICFNAAQAESDVRAFAGRCAHFIFCSTVCTYGIKTPHNVVVDETFPQEPISDYGKNKVKCEQIFLDSHASKKFNVTIIRPSSTYGPGGRLIDNLEFDPPAWDRIERGEPVLCSGDGLGLWVSTHRDDCGKLFAYAAMNRKTFGEAYNATRDENFTWREYYTQAASALGNTVRVIFMPASWIIRHDPARFGLLREITQFHGAYTSEKAKRDVPEFQCKIGFEQGARETFEDVKRRGAWKESRGDTLYETMIARALAAGVEPINVA